MFPLLTLSRPLITFKRVVLPQPDGPSNAVIPVSPNSKEVLLITWIWFFLFLLKFLKSNKTIYL